MFKSRCLIYILSHFDVTISNKNTRLLTAMMMSRLISRALKLPVYMHQMHQFCKTRGFTQPFFSAGNCSVLGICSVVC